MHRFLLLAFGVTTAFSSLCTMAYAEMTPSAPGRAGDMPAHAAGCASVERDGAVGMCEEQPSCQDASCFVRSSLQEEDTLTAGTSVLQDGLAVVPQAIEPVPLPQTGEYSPVSFADNTPPGALLTGVVLRE